MKKVLLILLFCLLLTPVFAQEELTLRESGLIFADDGDLPGLFPAPTGERVLVLLPGREYDLKTDLNGKRVKVTVSSSNEEVAALRSGKLKAICRGVCTLTLTCAREEVSPLTVTAAVITPVSEIRILKPADLFGTGESFPLEVSFQPEDADLKIFSVKSTEEEVATVDESGFTCLSPGYTVIEVTAMDGSRARDRIHAKVVQFPESISLSGLPEVLSVGSTVVVKAETLPAKCYSEGIRWSSSNQEVAKINSSGSLTGLSAGVCEIRAESVANPEVCAVQTLTVSEPVQAIRLPFEKVTLSAGETWDPMWRVVPEQENGMGVSFSSSDEKVAAVSPEGVVTAIAPGSCTVTAAADIGSVKTVLEVRVRRTVAQTADYAQPAEGGLPETETLVFGKSEMGRDLKVTRIGPENAEKRALLTFVMHGFEDKASRDGEYVFQTGQDLIRRLMGRSLGENTAVWIVQCVNPDGLIGGGGTSGFGRCNALYYDINRDFPAGWEWTDFKRNRTGRTPFTTTEARALRDLAEAVAPTFAADIHGFIHCVYGSEGPGRIFAEEMNVPYTTMWSGGMFVQWMQEQCGNAVLVELTWPEESTEPAAFAAETAPLLEAALLRVLGE